MFFGFHPTHQACDLILKKSPKYCCHDGALALGSNKWAVTVGVGE